MARSKLEYLILVILVASVGVNIYQWFKPEEPLDKSEEERLKAQNELLESRVDSLLGVNDEITAQQQLILMRLDTLNTELDKNEKTIRNLNLRRRESIRAVDALDDGELDSLFSTITIP
jgi:hypothetical protein